MYLLVDAQALQAADVRNRGIGRYTSELIRALTIARPQWRIEAVVNAAMPDADTLGDSIPIRTFEPLLRSDPSATEANERYFGDWLSALAPDAVLEPNFFEGEGLVPTFTAPRPFLAGVAYDLIPLLFDQQYLAGAAARRKYVARLRRFAETDLILAISESTRDDVIRLLRWPPSQVVTILGGAGHTGSAPVNLQSGKAALARLRIDRPFVLCVGGADPRKNLRGALAAFAALPSDLRSQYLLVIVCALTADQASDLTAEATRLGVDDALRVTGFIDDQDLQTLYKTCRLLLFPSYYEGLGLPVLEALEAGAPVVASNRSAIPEFAGPASWLVDPASPADIASAVRQALAEPYEARLEERRRFAAGFTWSDVARRAADAIESRVAARSNRPSRRTRIAWVSPLPPTRSGISDYSAELLEHLAADFDIELVVCPGAATASTLASRFHVLHGQQVFVRHQHAPFDLFVYHVGNSDLHVYMLDLMREQPGLVVLHDVMLGGLALRARAAGRWPGNLPSAIEGEGQRELATQLRRGEGDHGRIDASVLLCASLVEPSDAVIVHSAWSWRQVRPHTSAPVFRIPMGVPPVPVQSPALVRTRLGLTSGAFVIATLGEVTPAKQVDRLIRAVASLPDRIRARTQLVVVGAITSALLNTLSDIALGSRVSDRVRFTGRVPLDQLTDWSRAADVCVQLRFPTRGETSAALLRALAAGGVCVVSDGGSFAELPSEVALRVSTRIDDVESVRDALVRVHDEPGLGERLRERARRFAEAAHGIAGAAEAYAAAIRLTVARRTSSDAAWVQAAGAALAAVRGHHTIDEPALRRWAELRGSVGKS